jgi:hypothetical protein
LDINLNKVGNFLPGSITIHAAVRCGVENHHNSVAEEKGPDVDHLAIKNIAFLFVIAWAGSKNPAQRVGFQHVTIEAFGF